MKELIQLNEPKLEGDINWIKNVFPEAVKHVEKELILEFVNALYCCIETKTFGEFKNEWVLNLGMFKHQVKKWEEKL